MLIVFLESMLFVALIDVDGSDCADDDIDNHDDVDDITMMLADGVDVDDKHVVNVSPVGNKR